MTRGMLVCAALTALAGCGVETATTAATGAAVKKQEIEQARKTQEEAKRQVEQAMQQMQQRVDQATDATSR